VAPGVEGSSPFTHPQNVKIKDKNVK